MTIAAAMTTATRGVGAWSRVIRPVGRGGPGAGPAFGAVGAARASSSIVGQTSRRGRPLPRASRRAPPALAGRLQARSRRRERGAIRPGRGLDEGARRGRDPPGDRRRQGWPRAHLVRGSAADRDGRRSRARRSGAHRATDAFRRRGPARRRDSRPAIGWSICSTSGSGRRRWPARWWRPTSG